MRKLIYYVACTIDRFIAREDGSFEGFLTEGDHLADLAASFPETFPTHLWEHFGIQGEKKWFDTVLMGRMTYEVGLKLGVTNPYDHLRQYVVSSSMRSSPDENVELVSTDPLSFVRQLKKEQGMSIWLCGGGRLACSLFPEIDELILKINPCVFGSGVPLISGNVEPKQADLLDHKIYQSGCILMRYRLTTER